MLALDIHDQLPKVKCARDKLYPYIWLEQGNCMETNIVPPINDHFSQSTMQWNN